MDIDIVKLLAAIMIAATPILFAAIGELVAEKAGLLNLGVEGMLLTGAVCGYIIGHETGSATAGFIGAAIGGAGVSAIFAFLTLVLMTNQVPTGLALTLFGAGLAALVGQGYSGGQEVSISKMNIPVLEDIPVLGTIFFQHDMIVYLSVFVVLGVWIFLRYSRAGLVLKAVGENGEAAHALGYNVRLVRLAAILFGGACAGVGGAYISLVRVPQWTDDMTGGAGWIALAIVVFASWKPWQLIAGAYLFGGVTVLQLNLQAEGLAIPVEYLSMTPYIATIIALVLLPAGRAPASLGKTFHAVQ